MAMSSPKQSATTGFVIGLAIGIAITAIIFFVMQKRTTAAAQPPAARVASEHVGTTGGQLFVSGTIDLERSASNHVRLPAVVFVMARAEAATSHPLLVRRLEVRSFPVEFALSSEDSMLGEAPPSRIALEARVDSDGDASTREPDAPVALLRPVALGSDHVRLVLKR